MPDPKLFETQIGPGGHKTFVPVFKGFSDHQKELVLRDKNVRAVFEVLRDGKRRTAAQVATESRVGLGQVTARIRDLRKMEYGGWDVPKAHRVQPEGGDALYFYRMVLDRDGKPKKK